MEVMSQLIKSNSNGLSIHYLSTSSMSVPAPSVPRTNPVPSSHSGMESPSTKSHTRMELPPLALMSAK